MTATAESIIRAHASPELLEEIQYFLDLDCEEGEDGYTFVSAWNTVLGRADDPDFYNAKFLKNVRRVGIALGVYREISDAELSRTYVSRGKAYDFALDGKKYLFDKHVTD